MPARSEAQQRLMGMVRAYQKGDLPDSKASALVKRLAKTMSKKSVKHYASTDYADIKEFIKDIVSSPEYVEECILEIVETKTPNKVKGQTLDIYTASLLATVMERLDEKTKKDLLSFPINEMVALSYKVLSY